ncbi:TlpA family protein disulfide reductase [Chitinophaga horti]|uniref:TlpA family protein disulfide reductase n=1 Tax=Chitinophaga horti TaxID=2920382 RepID=A0ABY6J8G7_9BACT|nr:TlpA disulfide reductase family protein [Chitinophaga horti]UYQ95978.1 TlpA family protein disulfide reductase [Chitinophaga horti]
MRASYGPKEVVPVIAVGTAAPEFSQTSTNGKPLALSGLRGKYVLIDFWASWCGPCRKVNPDLVKLYEQFKGNSFEILGVSLDSDDAKWKEAIQKDGLTWQHTSDLKGWKNDVAALYGIKAVPQNFLVDPSGKVIAKNLRIAQLEEELRKLLKQ